MIEERTAEGREERADARPTGPARGQIIVMFAIFLVGLMGLLGLATDLGMAFAQRRTMQNSADAGALAGTRAVARWTATAPTSAQADVTIFVGANKMDTTPTIDECVYVSYNNTSQGGCGLTVPAGAKGVRVRVREVHDTFFIRAVPGMPNTVTVTATATAYVQRFNDFPNQAPFIVCGSHSWAVKDTNSNNFTGQGRDIPILTSSGTGAVSVNPAAVGVTFRIHDNKISQGSGIPKDAGCKTTSGRFNGLADQNLNGGKEANAWHHYTEGTHAGPTREKVNGIQGCEIGQEVDCVMLLPIAVDNPSEDQAPEAKEVWVVGYAAFFVTYNDSNSHNGRLLGNYLVSGPSDQNWCRDCSNGVAVIRMGN